MLVIALEDRVGMAGDGVEPADDDLDLGGRLPISFAVRASSRTLRTSSRRVSRCSQSVFDVLDVAGDDVGRCRGRGRGARWLRGFDFGEELPDLLGGEAEDGRDEAGEGFGDAPESGLGAAAAGVIGGEGVEAVL